MTQESLTYKGPERRIHHCERQTEIALMTQRISFLEETYKSSISEIKAEIINNTTLSLEILQTIKGDGSHDKPGILTELAVSQSSITRLWYYFGGVVSGISIFAIYVLNKLHGK